MLAGWDHLLTVELNNGRADSENTAKAIVRSEGAASNLLRWFYQEGLVQREKAEGSNRLLYRVAPHIREQH